MFALFRKALELKVPISLRIRLVRWMAGAALREFPWALGAFCVIAIASLIAMGAGESTLGVVAVTLLAVATMALARLVGSRHEQGIPLLNHLASSGWVGFNIDYRLSPRATFPEHIVDVKRAIAWVREHAGEYGADPTSSASPVARPAVTSARSPR